MNKVLASASKAVESIPDGATIMMGGFGLCGIPENLIEALHAQGTRDLTVISNNAGIDDFGIGILLQARQVRKMIATYVGENKEFERQYPRPASSRSNSCRRARSPSGFAPAAPASAVSSRRPATARSSPKARRRGPSTASAYVLEMPLRADFAFVKAWKGDRAGNLVYRRTARNFNPMMATAARVTIAEVEQLVEPGEIDPDHVVTPGIFVQAHPAGRRTTRSASRSARSRTDVMPMDISRTHRQARRPRAEGRRLRQPRHRHADAGGQPHAAGHRHHAAFGERHARRRPYPDRGARSIRI